MDLLGAAAAFVSNTDCITKQEDGLFCPVPPTLVKPPQSPSTPLSSYAFPPLIPPSSSCSTLSSVSLPSITLPSFATAPSTSPVPPRPVKKKPPRKKPQKAKQSPLPGFSHRPPVATSPHIPPTNSHPSATLSCFQHRDPAYFAYYDRSTTSYFCRWQDNVTQTLHRKYFRMPKVPVPSSDTDALPFTGESQEAALTALFDFIDTHITPFPHLTLLRPKKPSRLHPRILQSHSGRSCLASPLPPVFDPQTQSALAPLSSHIDSGNSASILPPPLSLPATSATPSLSLPAESSSYPLTTDGSTFALPPLLPSGDANQPLSDPWSAASGDSHNDSIMSRYMNGSMSSSAAIPSGSPPSSSKRRRYSLGQEEAGTLLAELSNPTLGHQDVSNSPFVEGVTDCLTPSTSCSATAQTGEDSPSLAEENWCRVTYEAPTPGTKAQGCWQVQLCIRGREYRKGLPERSHGTRGAERQAKMWEIIPEVCRVLWGGGFPTVEHKVEEVVRRCQLDAGEDGRINRECAAVIMGVTKGEVDSLFERLSSVGGEVRNLAGFIANFFRNPAARPPRKSRPKPRDSMPKSLDGVVSMAGGKGIDDDDSGRPWWEKYNVSSGGALDGGGISMGVVTDDLKGGGGMDIISSVFANSNLEGDSSFSAAANNLFATNSNLGLSTSSTLASLSHFRSAFSSPSPSINLSPATTTSGTTAASPRWVEAAANLRKSTCLNCGGASRQRTFLDGDFGFPPLLGEEGEEEGWGGQRRREHVDGVGGFESSCRDTCDCVHSFDHSSSSLFEPNSLSSPSPLMAEFVGPSQVGFSSALSGSLTGGLGAAITGGMGGGIGGSATGGGTGMGGLGAGVGTGISRNGLGNTLGNSVGNAFCSMGGGFGVGGGLGGALGGVGISPQEMESMPPLDCMSQFPQHFATPFDQFLPPPSSVINSCDFLGSSLLAVAAAAMPASSNTGCGGSSGHLKNSGGGSGACGGGLRLEDSQSGLDDMLDSRTVDKLA
eukprot:GHVS01083127.1.p1 GENE.GHVS01083127.1~~GHVS01083127.1.p1  ORF type:complete len:1036 (+),score=181.85 GHVS01083127.1:112-3108(+)